MKKLLFILLCLIANNAIAQKTKVHDTANKFIVEVDYNTGEVNHFLQKGNTKKVRPKKGSYIQVRMINCPEGVKLTGSVTFENVHLEALNNYTTLLSPNALKVNTEAPKSEKEEPKNDPKKVEETISNLEQQKEMENKDKADKEKNDAIEKNFEKGNDKDAKQNEKVLSVIVKDKLYKINPDELTNKIQLTVIERYLNQQVETNKLDKEKLEKAKEELEWYKRVIQYAEDNHKHKVHIRDSILKIFDLKIKELEISLSKLKVKVDTFRLSDVYVPDSDFSLINLKVVNAKNETIKEIAPQSFYNKGGFKIDFSTGVFYTSLKDEKYRVISHRIQASSTAPIIEVDSIKTIIKEDDGRGKLAFGILAHTYFRTSEYFNVSLSGGFNYQLEDKIANGLIGASIILGSKGRVIISGGFAIGSIKVLNYKLYQEEKLYRKDVLNENTDLYKNKYVARPFAGLTFNLSNLGATKKVSHSF